VNKLDEFAPIFYPQSHAIIGASADVRKFSGRYLQTVLAFGFSGRLYPVNPQETEVLGLKSYPSVLDIPEPVDFATIVVPARAVPKVAAECLTKGVKGVQVLSAGFREVGPEGERLEKELGEIAAKGLRIIGPNCFGVYSPDGGITILPGANLPKDSGPVAFISQSGGYSIRMPRRGSGMGLRFSKVISYGNACDINECDLIEYLYQDPQTKIITGYIEGVKDGRRFFELLKEVCRTKPVILWKGGLTKAGARAVQSHTASLGGGEEIWDAVFRQTGAVRVSGLEELLDTTLAFLQLQPESRGKASVIGGGGGIGVAAADICERVGLSLEVFPTEVQKKLASIVPPSGASVRNPVDVASPVPPAPMLKAVLETIATEADVDILIVDELEMAARMLLPENEAEQAQVLTEGLAQVPVDIKAKSGKSVVMVMPVEAIGSDGIESERDRRRISEFYFQHKIPVFMTIERAAKALVNFISYHRRNATMSSPSRQSVEVMP